MAMLRRLTQADLPSYADAQRSAFGGFAEQRPDFDLDAGVPVAFGVFDDERLIAKLAAYPLLLDLGGRRLAANGVADVTTDIIHRGRGLARTLLAELLRAERSRGAVASVLYPSVPAVYRSYGYASVATRDLVRLDASSLARARIAPDLAVAAASAAQASDAYEALLVGMDGVLTPLPPGRASQRDIVIRREGADVALLRYERTPAALVCDLLVAADRDAWQAGLALLASETGGLSVDVWSSPHDPGWHWYPNLPTVIGRTTPMMRPVDVAAALEARGWPQGASDRWQFNLTDPLLAENSGGYRLSLDDGRATVERLDQTDGPQQSVADIAALLAGVRRVGDRQWAWLPDGLLEAAALRDWTLVIGF